MSALVFPLPGQDSFPGQGRRRATGKKLFPLRDIHIGRGQ